MPPKSKAASTHKPNTDWTEFQFIASWAIVETIYNRLLNPIWNIAGREWKTTSIKHNDKIFINQPVEIPIKEVQKTDPLDKQEKIIVNVKRDRLELSEYTFQKTKELVVFYLAEHGQKGTKTFFPCHFPVTRIGLAEKLPTNEIYSIKWDEFASPSNKDQPALISITLENQKKTNGGHDNVKVYIITRKLMEYFVIYDDEYRVMKLLNYDEFQLQAANRKYDTDSKNLEADHRAFLKLGEHLKNTVTEMDVYVRQIVHDNLQYRHFWLQKFLDADKLTPYITVYDCPDAYHRYDPDRDHIMRQDMDDAIKFVEDMKYHKVEDPKDMMFTTWLNRMNWYMEQIINPTSPIQPSFLEEATKYKVAEEEKAKSKAEKTPQSKPSKFVPKPFSYGFTESGPKGRNPGSMHTSPLLKNPDLPPLTHETTDRAQPPGRRRTIPRTPTGKAKP